MSLWVFIWLLLSAALIYFFGWTLWITFQQKRTWKAYAQKHKFRYTSGNFYDPPEMAGMIEAHQVSLFTGEHLLVNDERGRTRKMTAIEVMLNTHAPTAGGAASGGLVNFIKGLEFKHEIKPDHPGWADDYIVLTDSRAVMRAYLTTVRIEALLKIMNIKSAWTILVFREDVALLRFDTTKPLADPKRLNKIIRALVETAKILELDEGEEAILKRAKAKQSEKETALDVKDDDLDTGLELEDD
jgi:hypothetical protein